jgi:predicted P-loop ATPase
MTQPLTVLTTTGPSLTKTWLADGTIKDYDLARNFTVRQPDVDGVVDLYKLLRKMAGTPRNCIIRGTPTTHTLERAGPVERNLANFDDRPSRLFMIDVDNFEPRFDPVDDPKRAVAVFINTLPECFRDTAYVAQLSSSMGHPTKEGLLRCHLWFWLAEPMTCAQAEAWSKRWLPGADSTVHRTVQVNYTANPLVQDGDIDPIASRVWLGEGCFDQVAVPHDMPMPAVDEAVLQRDDRLKMADPHEKPGIIGAVCRAFEPADILTLWPDLFAEGSKPERMTWLAGGGTAEGLFVSSDGKHIGNSHDSSPVGKRAQNMFDFVRTHVYGHLDADTDPDVLELEPTAAPAYKATLEWARQQPEVVQESTGPKAEAAQEAAADSKALVAIAAKDETADLLKNVLALVASCPDHAVMEHELGRRVAANRLLGKTERALIAKAMCKRLALLDMTLPLPLVTSWLIPIQAALIPFRDLDKQSQPRATIENVEMLAANLDISISYNVISKRQEVECTRWGLGDGTDDRANTTLTRLQSECAKVGLPYNMSIVKGYVNAIAADNPFNPVDQWIRSKPWDGVGRFEDLARTLTPSPSQDPALLRLILRKWLVQCVAIGVSNDSRQMARGVFTIQSTQYAGKSRWAKALVPGMEHLVITGLVVDPGNKDKTKIAVSYWISELGELDATFKKADLAALKAWISQDEDVMRLPYAATESRFKRRTSFFATVNGDRYLNDDTGNTRFWGVSVSAVNPNHGIDMQQLWAEICAAWEGGELSYFTPAEMKLVDQTVTEEHAVHDSWFERIAAGFEWDGFDPLKPDHANALSATQVGVATGTLVPNSSDLQRIAAAVKKLGALAGPRKGELRTWALPPKVVKDDGMLGFSGVS